MLTSLHRQLIDIPSVTGDERMVGQFLHSHLERPVLKCNYGKSPQESLQRLCQNKWLTSRCSFERTWTPYRRRLREVRTKTRSMVAVLATPRELSLLRFLRPSVCVTKG